MRFVKVLAALVLCAAVLVSGSVTAFADTDMSGSAWDMLLWEERNIEEHKYWINSLQLRRIDELPEDIKDELMVGSYDVSQDGKIAIAFSNESLIAVYDENFEFEYAISFCVDGAYGVLWCGDHVALIDCRGEGATLIDENAVPIAMYNITGAKEEYDYWYDIVKSRTRMWNGFTYFCYNHNEPEFFYDVSSVGSCHVIERTDCNGNVEVVYEVEAKRFEDLWLIVLIVALPVMAYIAYRIDKKKRDNEPQQQSNGVEYTPPLRKV